MDDVDATPEGRHLAAISENECWQLFASRPWGRLAVIVEDHPEVFPVDHLVADRTLLVRTERGAKLRSAVGARVAFQLDAVDEDRLGWSVLAVGYAEEVDDPRAVGVTPEEAAAALWTDERVHWLRIVPFKVTGRRLVAD